MIKNILIPVGTLLFGVIGTFIFTMVKYKKELAQIEKDNAKWEKDFAERQLLNKQNILREAMLMARNNKQSRLAAYREYKACGGYNYEGYDKVLEDLPEGCLEN